MARIWSCGFELQSVTAGVEFDGLSGTGISINTTTKRSGGAALRVVRTGTAGTSYIYHQCDADDVAYARVYVYIATAPSATTAIIELCDDTSQGTVVGIELNTNRTLQFYYSNASFVRVDVGSASSALALNTWYCIEIMANTTTEDVEAKLDGTSFASVNATGFGYLTFGRIYLGIDAGAWGDTATADLYFDDIAWNDDTGTNQTSFPGAGSIVHMQPDSAGDNNDAVSGDYSSVDEVTPDDATTIAVLDDNNDILDVNCETSVNAGIGASDTITLVQVGIREAAASAAEESWQVRIKSQASGTVLASATTTHNDTTYKTNGDALPQVYKLTSYVDPQAAGAWTPALLDTMQIGVKAIDATPDINVSTLWALVEYVPVSAQQYSKTFTETMAISEPSIVKASSRPFSETLTTSESFVRAASRVFIDTGTLTESFVKERAFGRIFTEIISLVESFSKVGGWIRDKDAGGTWNKKTPSSNSWAKRTDRGSGWSKRTPTSSGWTSRSHQASDWS